MGFLPANFQLATPFHSASGLGTGQTTATNALCHHPTGVGVVAQFIKYEHLNSPQHSGDPVVTLIKNTIFFAARCAMRRTSKA